MSRPTITRYTLAVTTDVSGNATVFSDEDVNGRVLQVRYEPHASTPLDTGADIDITGQTTGVVVANHDNIGTAAFTRRYRDAMHGIDGAAAVYAAAGEPVEGDIWLSDEKIKLVVANGAATKSGTFYVWVG